MASLSRHARTGQSLLSVFLALALVVGMCPSFAWATEGDGAAQAQTDQPAAAQDESTEAVDSAEELSAAPAESTDDPAEGSSMDAAASATAEPDEAATPQSETADDSDSEDASADTTLEAQSTLEAQANNPFATAKNVSLNTYAYGTSTSSDDEDYYKITIPKAGRYTLSFVGDDPTSSDPNNWGVYLYDYDRNLIRSASYNHREVKRAEWTDYLPAGAAYVRVVGGYGASGSGYHLRLSAEGATPADTTSFSSFTKVAAGGSEREPNNDFSSANLITAGSYVYGVSPSSDDNDFYALNLPKAGRYTLSFVGDDPTSSDPNNWGVYLYDYDRNLIRSASYNHREVKRAEWTDYLPAGAAYVRVVGGYGASGSGYHLKLEFSSMPISDATISDITDKQYTGGAITQNLTVKCGSITLTEGVDYTVSYENNVNVGTATVLESGLNSRSQVGEISPIPAKLISPIRQRLRLIQHF